MDLRPGQVVAGKYRLERELGAGGMGSVYVAENVVLRKRVAFKVLTAGRGAHAVELERFLREGVAASRVRHPGIVEVFDAGVDQGLPWIAMELLEGESLQQRLDRVGRLEVAEAVSLATAVLSALTALHDEGIVHRDIKPGNIFLARRDGDGKEEVRPTLVDFGIAKQVDRTQFTAPGMLLGTAHFLAPEQAVDSASADQRSDVYSVGAVLFRCLSGELPIEASTLAELISKLQFDRPRLLREVAPELPPPLAMVVQACLARDPDARPQSAVELSRALEAAMSGAPDPLGHGAAATGMPLASSPARREPAATAETVAATPTPLPPTAYHPSAQSWTAAPPPMAPSAPPMPMPTPAGFAPARPLAVAKGSGWPRWATCLIVTVVGLMILGVVAAFVVPAVVIGAGMWQGCQRTSSYLQWDSAKRPLVAEVNGDGAADVVGWINVMRGYEFYSRVAAFDGRSGRELWRSDELGAMLASGDSRAAVAGRHVVIADAIGRVRGLDLESGGEAWRFVLAERVDRICAAGEGHVLLVAADGQAQRVDLSNGTHAPVAGAVTCESRLDAHLEHQGFEMSVSGVGTEIPEPPAVPGMRVDRALSTPGGLVVAFGARETGTAVPQVAALRSGQVLWVHDAPESAPLGVVSGRPEAALVGSSRVVVVYGLASGGRRLTSFDLESGARPWDVVFPDESRDVRSMAFTGDLVLVSHWCWLDAFDATTGEHRYRIGRWQL